VGGGESGSDITKKNSLKLSFPSFYYHEINSIFEQLFYLCFRETKSGRGGLFFRTQNGAFCCILDIKSV
jgi:coproporphyrinogen III oxidase